MTLYQFILVSTIRWSCFIVHILKNLIFSPFGFREQFCRFLRNCRQDSEDNLDNQSILVLRLRIFLSDFSKNTFVISVTLETKTDWQWYQKLPIQLHNHITIIMIMMAFRVLIDDNNGNQDNVKMNDISNPRWEVKWVVFLKPRTQ